MPVTSSMPPNCLQVNDSPIHVFDKKETVVSVWKGKVVRVKKASDM